MYAAHFGLTAAILTGLSLLFAGVTLYLWNTLSDPDVRRQQVERMLNDPKSAAFNRHFTMAWLRLDKLGKMPPSGGDYQFYKNLKVEPMLLEQVAAYFSDILERNGPIEEFTLYFDDSSGTRFYASRWDGVMWAHSTWITVSAGGGTGRSALSW